MALCVSRGGSFHSTWLRTGRRKEQPAHCDKLPAEHNVFAWVVMILRVLHHVLAQPLVLGALQRLLSAGISLVQIRTKHPKRWLMVEQTVKQMGKRC